MIPFHGVYTRGQFFRGIRLALRPSRRALVLRGLGALIAFGVIGAYIVVAVSGEGIPTSRLIRTGITALFLLYWAVSPFVASWWAASRQWRKAGGQLSLRGVATDEGVISNALASEALDRWENFLRAHMRADMVVLVGADGLATILPRTFFADEGAWSSFCQMVDFKVAPPR